MHLFNPAKLFHVFFPKSISAAIIIFCLFLCPKPEINGEETFLGWCVYELAITFVPSAFHTSAHFLSLRGGSVSSLRKGNRKSE
jgi:putative effector of murein hydrolase LrgA (UPF0299 family)